MAAMEMSTDRPRPLAAMTRLTPRVRVQEPATTARTSTSTDPKLVVMFSWMGAKDVHVAKYTAPLAETFPSSRIMLISADFWTMLGDIMTGGTAKTYKQLAPAVEYIQSAVADTDEKDGSRPQILLHAFSNGGSFNLIFLRRAYLRATGKPLPPNVVVYDSCPGARNYWPAIEAFASWAPARSLMKILVAYPLAHFAFWIYWFNAVVLRNDLGLSAWNGQNDRKLCATEARRTYVYSKEDLTIPWGDVEWHARDGKEAGFDVRLEMFEGSLHVAHMRTDPQRYWKIVKETWQPSS